jgi:hypothetical protein
MPRNSTCSPPWRRKITPERHLAPRRQPAGQSQ